MVFEASLVGAAQEDRAAPARETLRLYAADWTRFERWCAARGLAALPALPATVAAYLGAKRGDLGAGALARSVAAIGREHRRHGLPHPGRHDTVAALLREARRDGRVPDAPRRHRRKPPGAAQLARMAAACPGDLAGLRDRAILLLLAAGIGKDALLGLDYEDVRLRNTGGEITVGGAGQQEVVPLRPAASVTACPIDALRRWLGSSDTRFGPLFRKVDRWGKADHHRLSPDGLRRILLARALTRAGRVRARRNPHAKQRAAKPQKAA